MSSNTCRVRTDESRPDVGDSLREPLIPRSEEATTSFEDRRSRNITLSCLYTIFAFSGRSTWSQSVLSTYVFLLTGDVKAVGYVSAVMGISQLLASIPTGIIADMYRRDYLLKFSSLLCILAIAATFLACWHENIHYLMGALVFWGSFYGVTNTTLDAHFTDSIPVGERSRYFTRRESLLRMSNISGPVVSLLMFLTLGNHWTVRECAIVMAVGMCVCSPAVVILCLFSDDDDGKDDVQQSGSNNSADQQCRRQGRSETSITLASESDNSGEPTTTEARRNCCAPSQRLVPTTIAVSDVMSGLASGMSIRYFPIFFVDNLKMNPVLVQVLYILSPLLMVILMRIARRLACRYGRLHIVVMYKWLGVFFMLAMSAAYAWFKLPASFICTLYVLRTAFMNSPSALGRSALMDHVPRTERAKWSSLESVNMFSWSGSAALGGMLVAKYGIVPMFVVTGILQGLATLPLLAIFDHDLPEHEHSASLSSFFDDDDHPDVVPEQDEHTVALSRTPSQVMLVRQSSNSSLESSSAEQEEV